MQTAQAQLRLIRGCFMRSENAAVAPAAEGANTFIAFQSSG